MDITVKGKQMDAGDALRVYVEENLAPTVSKYFDRALDAAVVFSREAHNFRADISVHAGRGVTMQGRADASDAHAAFDAALERIAKQLRRYKRRLQDHQKQPMGEVMTGQYSIIQSVETEEEEAPDAQPTIVADMSHEISTLTVSEAVMRLDLADAPAMMFRNRAHGRLNVVYRRADGNVGWIDPLNNQESQTA